MTDRFLVLGGQQRDNADWLEEWHHYRKAIVVRASAPEGPLEVCAEHVTPAQACPDARPSVIFKAGCLVGRKLYVCTQTEALIYQLPEFRRVGYLSLPAFNDLHHVRPSGEDRLLLAVTGIDLVLELSLEGRRLREWSVVEEDPWLRFDRRLDYRKVSTTKPHLAHPNFVFTRGDEVWVTRFEQRDALCLTDPGPIGGKRRIAIDYERPHDGHVLGDKVYFTTVDGRVVVADLNTCAVERMIDLNEIESSGAPLGWCRGLHLVDEDRVVVGFSRLRPSRFRQNLRWVRDRFRGPGRERGGTGERPTRIALYDLGSRRLCWEREVESAGLNSVFSIHAEGRDDVMP